MRIEWRAAGMTLGLAIFALAGGGCMGTKALSTAPQGTAVQAASMKAGPVSTEGSDSGAGGQLPAFYDGRPVEINVVELSDKATGSLLAHNQNLNQIFVTNDLDDPQDFDPVIDAVPADGFNPLWRQIRITFNQGTTPHQFTSDEDVASAAEGGQITLTDTGEIYRCAVLRGGK